MTKFLCEYDEYGPGMGFPSIKEFFNKKPYDGLDMIADYLENEGKTTLVSLQIDTDFFTGENLPFSKSGMTDGEYSWMRSLAYYVRNYNLRLPEEFEEKVIKFYKIKEK